MFNLILILIALYIVSFLVCFPLMLSKLGSASINRDGHRPLLIYTSLSALYICLIVVGLLLVLFAGYTIKGMF